MLITTKAFICDLVTPNPNLRTQVTVDLLNNIFVFDDEFERYNVSCSMDSLVRSSTAN